MDWMKIGSALLLGMMIVAVYPRVKHSMQNSHKAEKGDWMSFIVPIVAVIGFVMLLIMMV